MGADMTTWRIETNEKKNIYTRQVMVVSDDSPVAAGKTFYIDEWYRWGYVVIEQNEKPLQNDDPYKFPLDVTEFEVVDQSFDDGVSLQIEFEDDWLEDERLWIESMYEEEGWAAFDERGIYMEDVETQFYGPVDITCVDDTPTPDPEPIPPGTGWPF